LSCTPCKLIESLSTARIYQLYGLSNDYFFAGSIARSAKRRYLSYSEADFEDFRPSGATRCTDWGESWPGGGGPEGPPPPSQISLHRCNGKGIWTQKTKFLLRFDQNVEFKRPAGAYPLPYFSAHVCAMSIVAKRSPISATAELLF